MSYPNVQDANTVYAGPASGADAVPTFRALVAADFGSGSDDQVLTKSGTGAVWADAPSGGATGDNANLFGMFLFGGG